MTTWSPPGEVDRDCLYQISEQVLARPDKRIERWEEVFELESAGLRWVVGGEILEPVAVDALRATDGRKVGAFLLHGGGGDHRQLANLAEVLATKFGIKVHTFTYPGHINLHSADRNWPGEPLDDGAGNVRLPIWDPDDPIGHDESELIEHRGDDLRRRQAGTTYFLRAKPGSQFYIRQATWPLAYEAAYIEACRRAFPQNEYRVFLHGHSTGGPQVHMLLNRIPNASGLFGLESSAFGEIVRRMHSPSMTAWDFPFEDLAMRTWRDSARYIGAESQAEFQSEASDLPSLMEQVWKHWDVAKGRPGFKAEHYVQMAAIDTLTAAAVVSAKHMQLSDDATRALIVRYHGYTKPSNTAGRGLPPLMYIINRYSRDHRFDNYQGTLLPALQLLEPAPRVALTRLGAGVHDYNRPEDGLPQGTAPVAARLWFEALVNGFFDVGAEPVNS